MGDKTNGPKKGGKHKGRNAHGGPALKNQIWICEFATRTQTIGTICYFERM
jgi:hypothetical protein